MSVRIHDEKGKHHEYLYLDLRFVKVIEAIHQHYPEARMFCDSCGIRHTMQGLLLETAREFKHRVETAQEQCQKYEQEDKDKIARDIAMGKSVRSVWPPIIKTGNA